MTIRLALATGNVGGRGRGKGGDGEEEAIEVVANTGQQVVQAASPYVTFRLVSDCATWAAL